MRNAMLSPAPAPAHARRTPDPPTELMVRLASRSLRRTRTANTACGFRARRDGDMKPRNARDHTRPATRPRPRAHARYPGEHGCPFSLPRVALVLRACLGTSGHMPRPALSQLYWSYHCPQCAKPIRLPLQISPAPRIPRSPQAEGRLHFQISTQSPQQAPSSPLSSASAPRVLYVAATLVLVLYVSRPPIGAARVPRRAPHAYRAPHASASASATR